MMAVGDVKKRNAREFGRDEPDVRSVPDRPRRVPHAIRRREIDRRLPGGPFRDKLIDRRNGRIGQEDRAGLGMQGFHVENAVFLLVWPREFMLSDDAPEIFPAARHAHEPHLAVPAHDLPVKIEARPLVLAQRAEGQQPVKILLRFRVNFRRMRVGRRRQIDFRPADVEETERISRGDPTGLLRRHDIVRQLANASGQFRPGAHCGEGFDGCHNARRR